MKSILLLTLSCIIMLASCVFAEHQFGTKINLESRYFLQEGEHANTGQSENTLRLRFDYSYSWDHNRKVIQFAPYAMWSSPDHEKSHFDLREASFLGSFGQIELRFGISKIFWGVTESVHLVDVINQTDLVEDPDGEEKLGQPMLALETITVWGTIAGFVLPYFRERPYPGNRSRLRGAILIDDDPVYESSEKQRHLDTALRWEHSFSYFDIGLSRFEGTSRDPILVLGSNSDGEPIFIPHYQLIRQIGIDAQVTMEAILFKHESIFRNYLSSEYDDFYAQAIGLEYSFYSIAESQIDLGLILEYISSDKENNALTPFDNHSFFAVRLGFNDTQDTSFLAGFIFDNESTSRIVSMEASRRLFDELTGSVEVRGFHFEEDDESSLSSFRKDSFVQIDIEVSF